jgi:hypothetical protein
MKNKIATTYISTPGRRGAREVVEHTESGRVLGCQAIQGGFEENIVDSAVLVQKDLYIGIRTTDNVV